MTRLGFSASFVCLLWVGCSYPGYEGFSDQKLDAGPDVKTEAGTETGTGGSGGSGGSSGCQGDNDCQEEGKPACDPAKHACVGCTGNEHCAGGTLLHCDPVAQQCVGCVLDADCPAGRCEPTSGACVQCIEHKDCSAPKAFCETSKFTCVACTADDATQCTETKAPRCNTSTNTCAACLQIDDNCPLGKYCNLNTYSCQNGCKTDSECNTWDAGVTFTCDIGDGGMGTHRCKGCKEDDHCPLGQLCDVAKSECVAGCRLPSETGPGHGCPDGAWPDCCGGDGIKPGQCTNTVFGDVDNCGACGNKCGPNPPHAIWKCWSGKCDVDTCTESGLQNCDEDPTNGCEVDTRTDPNNCGMCTKDCAAGETCVNSNCQ